MAAIGFHAADERQFTIPTSGDTTIEVPLDVAGEGTIRGIVVDDVTGNAVPDADVALDDKWQGVLWSCGPTAVSSGDM